MADRQIIGWLRFEVAAARIGIRDRVGRLFRRDKTAGPGPDRHIPAYDPRLSRGSSTYGPRQTD